MTHKFKIEAGSFTCKGKIEANINGFGYYEYDEDSDRPTGELDNQLSEIIQKIGEFLKVNGTLEKFEVKPLEE